MKKFSVIIPVYNRPGEIDELLDSLAKQTFKGFETIVVEDGSILPAEDVCRKYVSKLDLKYFYKINEGPGATRNFGRREAATDFFIFFDSDCLVPPDYFEKLNHAAASTSFDAYGGPDAAAETFTAVQKAINYSMTSIFTTGGIRGGKASVEKFHPRSFNMGVSRAVFEKTGGFSSMRYGEDIDFSIRIVKAGFRSVLLRECFVYHKRRTNFGKFFRQVFHSGAARIHLYKRHPESLKLFHFFPSAFTLYTLMALPASLIFTTVIPVAPVILYAAAILIHSAMMTKSIRIAILSVAAAFTQLFGYGSGFILRAFSASGVR